jgi:hypothetical protein
MPNQAKSKKPKVYNSVDELAGELGISRASAYKLFITERFRPFESASASLFPARRSASCSDIRQLDHASPVRRRTPPERVRTLRIYLIPVALMNEARRPNGGLASLRADSELLAGEAASGEAAS